MLLVNSWTSSIGQCTRLRTSKPPRSSKWSAKLVHVSIVVLFAVAREQVITLWQCPEASCVAVDMLHRVIDAALYPGPCMAIKMAHSGGSLDPIVVFCLDINVAKGPCDI